MKAGTKRLMRGLAVTRRVGAQDRMKLAQGYREGRKVLSSVGVRRAIKRRGNAPRPKTTGATRAAAAALAQTRAGKGYRIS